MRKILYIHGMGGGGDSRIPAILKDVFDSSPCHPERSEGSVDVIVRTYDFDPEIAAEQIAGWVKDLKPSLVIGESLGSLHAIRIKGVPHLFVSPSLNAPLYFGWLAPLALIPGVTAILDRVYRPREGDRQPLHFTFRTLRKYIRHRKLALQNTPRNGAQDKFFAFFGTRDHYRRSGIVSKKTWRKHFGNTFATYDGTHFMEEEFVRTILADKALEMMSES